MTKKCNKIVRTVAHVPSGRAFRFCSSWKPHISNVLYAPDYKIQYYNFYLNSKVQTCLTLTNEEKVQKAQFSYLLENWLLRTVLGTLCKNYSIRIRIISKHTVIAAILPTYQSHSCALQMQTVMMWHIYLYEELPEHTGSRSLWNVGIISTRLHSVILQKVVFFTEPQIWRLTACVYNEMVGMKAVTVSLCPSICTPSDLTLKPQCPMQIYANPEMTRKHLLQWK